MQLAQPEVTIAFDSDPAQAAMTRGRLLDRVANDMPAVIPRILRRLIPQNSECLLK